MTESFIVKDQDLYELASIVKGYYMKETPKAVLIRLPNGQSFWVPKKNIDSKFSCDSLQEQNFVIEDWILGKIGFVL